MAKDKATYEVVEEFADLANKLIALNEDKFGHIDTKMIRMTAITNKEPPTKPPFFKIIRVNNPVALFCPFRFVIVTWDTVWNGLELDQKGLVLLDVLHYLEPDEEEPRLIPPDIKDHSAMLRTFGVDYLNNSTIKGVFDKPIDWSEGGDVDFGKDEKTGKKGPIHPEVENVGETDPAFDAAQGDGEDWKKDVNDDDDEGESWKTGIGDKE